MHNLKNLIEHASKVPVFIASLALFILMTMTFSDVVMRSAFNAPIEAATELTRMLMAIIVFSVLPDITARDQHIVVDLFDGLFTNATIARIKSALISLACGGMLFWPATRVVILAERARDYGDVTEYLKIPQFYIGWFIAIMTFVTAIILIIQGLAKMFFPKAIGYKND